MPTWKIKGYRFYFKVVDLVKNKPAHVHVITEKGKIQFWLPTCEIKKIEGNVNEHEQNKLERIVRDNLDFFLKEWEKQWIKVK